jgi:hypothetical protein
LPLQSEPNFNQIKSLLSVPIRDIIQIHKFLLKRDSQVFRDLFSLPQPLASLDQGSKPLEGECEEHPLVFQDSVEDFRALCWALYARYVVGVPEIPRLFFT